MLVGYSSVYDDSTPTLLKNPARSGELSVAKSQTELIKLLGHPCKWIGYFPDSLSRD